MGNTISSIDWGAVWANVFTTSFIATAIIAVVGFVFRSLFTQIMSRDIEVFKVKQEMELESFKAALEKHAFEYQTRFSKLHEKQSEVISILYSGLDTTKNFFQQYAAVKSVTKEDTHEARLLQSAILEAMSVEELLRKNRLYFTKSVHDGIREFLDFFWQIALRADLQKIPGVGEYKEHIAELSRISAPIFENKHPWLRDWDKMTGEERFRFIERSVQSIEMELEQEFRRVLGAVEE